MNVIRSAGEEEDINEDQPEEEEDISEDERDAKSKENVVSTTARYDGERMVTTVSDMPTTERSTPAAKSTSRAETVEPSVTPLKLKENVTIRSEKRKNGTAVDLERKERIKRELAELESLFEATMAALSREDISDSSLHRVAWRLRTKRADTEMETSTSRTNNNGSQPDKDACVVRNMTCVKFPSRKHCKGIALGRCGSRTDLLVALFTPHVVMVTIVSVFVFVIVAIGLSYYCYRLRAENKIGPTETGSLNVEEEKENQVKQVQPVQDG